MVGEERFCSISTGCKQCPICNGKVGCNATVACTDAWCRLTEACYHGLKQC